MSKKNILFLVINFLILTSLIFYHSNLSNEVKGLKSVIGEKKPAGDKKIQIPKKSNVDEMIRFLSGLVQTYGDTIKIESVEFKAADKITIAVTTPNLETISEYLDSIENSTKNQYRITELNVEYLPVNESDAPQQQQQKTSKIVAKSQAQKKPAGNLPFALGYITQGNYKSKSKSDSTSPGASGLNSSTRKSKKRQKKEKEVAKYKALITVSI